MSDLEEKISSMSLTMSESQDEKILELNYEIEDLIKNLDSKFNDIKKSDIADISNMVSDISKTFVNFENRINFLMDDIKKSEAESLQDLNSELLNHKNLLEELNAKLDVFVSSDDTELLEDELAEIKEIIKNKENYLKDACGEYLKRLGAFCKTTVFELDEYRLPDSPSQSQIDMALRDEGERILKKAEGSTIIAMCIEAKQMDSETLAQTVNELSLTTSKISFVIGGSFGLSDEVKNKAKIKLSMSKMTFPHQLMRVILLEATYRAMTIIKGEPYHHQ